jgi:hypothetical protein
VARGAYPSAHPVVALSLWKTGDVLRRMGRSREARAQLERALVAAGGSARDQGRARLALGQLELALGRRAAARRQLEAARGPLAEHYGTPHPLLAELEQRLAEASAQPS